MCAKVLPMRVGWGADSKTNGVRQRMVFTIMHRRDAGGKRFLDGPADRE